MPASVFLYRLGACLLQAFVSYWSYPAIFSGMLTVSGTYIGILNPNVLP